MHRRRWLKVGLGAATLLALGGGLAGLYEPGLRSGRLGVAARVVFANLARAFLDGVLPAEPGTQRVAVDAFLERVDRLVEALPPHARQELSQLLALLATPAGRRGLAGLTADWPGASTEQLQSALQSMRTSSFALRQQAYQALHDITGAAYFSDPSAWQVLGYPGPLPI